jgi:RND family efflux transporter MFP subunit
MLTNYHSRITSHFLVMSMCFSFLFACNKKEADQAPAVRPAKIFTVGQGNGSLIRSFPGEVQSSNRAIQSFRVGGELIELPAVAGKTVKQGDVLARLDPKDFKLKYDDSKARFDLAKVQYERAKEILAKGLIARADYDKAKTRYLAASADLKLAKANLDYTVLKAPFDGVISKVHVDNFVNVKANEAIANIQSVENVDITFQIPENVIARIKKGGGKKADIQVRIDSQGDKTYPAQMKEFDTEADPQTQTFRALVTMARPKDFTLLEGMSTTVIIDFSQVFRDTADKIVLPPTAVFAAEDEPIDSVQRYVWLVNPDTMQVSKHAIKVGKLSDEGIEVLDGIETGQKIISAGVNFIQEGQKVKPMKREAGL